MRNEASVIALRKKLCVTYTLSIRSYFLETMEVRYNREPDGSVNTDFDQLMLPVLQIVHAMKTLDYDLEITVPLVAHMPSFLFFAPKARPER